MDKDMILQEKEAEVRLQVLHCTVFNSNLYAFFVFVLSYLPDHCNIILNLEV